MSQANSAIHGPYRRKVTLACDSCRKRRVKCSGSQPCTLCSESGRQCEFDSKNRGRRGPRPRRTVQPQRIVHQLAARIPSSRQVTVSSHPQTEVDLVWHPQNEMQDVEGTERCVTDDGDDEEEEEEEEDDDDDDHLSLDPSPANAGHRSHVPSHPYFLHSGKRATEIAAITGSNATSPIPGYHVSGLSAGGMRFEHAFHCAQSRTWSTRSGVC
ncbi:transcriptional regulatory protein STB4 [Penicillium concentricum]|uniref:Transcriptional regulatory protein STB4 n=1 Tax=Penicillium concentricum TaxID=293559 RepID=A0A9W9SB51_9EURO|nr:transcriptional regulatory protein STB4 [Penicillium concentricum]KAJ5373924.1 transcriptional regulatory protein STB4 [Penicillium concentricum]